MSVACSLGSHRASLHPSVQPRQSLAGGCINGSNPVGSCVRRIATARHTLSRLQAATDGGSGGSNSGGNGGDGGEGGGDGGGGNDGEDEENKTLSFKEVEVFMKEKNIQLPADMLETAKKFGLRLSALNAYAAVQGTLLSGFLARSIPFFRDRILADPKFLFKVGVEVVIDSGCTTVAEVRKRGDDFWKELELYFSDLMVGLVMDVVLVGLMAPAAVLGGAKMASQASGLQKLLSGIPSAVFAANVPGVRSYSLAQRMACILVKFCEYSLAGITCGLIGQGIASWAMEAHRSAHGVQENAVAVPPVFKTALVWGLFMGVSSNLRYQAVFGLERLVDMTIAKNVPAIAYLTTMIIRFGNNVVGGENFIDMARWAGVQ